MISICSAGEEDRTAHMVICSIRITTSSCVGGEIVLDSFGMRLCFEHGVEVSNDALSFRHSSRFAERKRKVEPGRLSCSTRDRE